mmetsp:Transcript_25253/g.53186  ORF Transcript_25253/g.53186 Transcript_25253/m.53186 type:complete len:233 (+) Transcript_25253:164-862(+)|eukprot:CAMPEP_0168232134 /NCGR_PEP_ID=MMETSP0140_2-20121125/16969_1 /TAXON_ID=44445 /ORGANISM="Pseudo-nitzschia australis, Strain 10249 10 AB" /LENGTH=232 /DNA_ID=CAMNT_0008164637 /DNA_START=107 /DNA_END=805 /DNA_ORIENTATION=+
MEVLTGSVSSNPVLLPNAELMEMLEKDVRANQTELERHQKPRKKGKSRGKSPFEHRDWIQKHVLEYLKDSPCVNIPTAKLRELKSRCTKKESSSSSLRKKRKAGGVSQSSPSSSSSPSKAKSSPDVYGLTEAEALQVLNHMPQEMVEMHLIVEDLHDRMSEAKQEDLLNMIRSYNTSVTTTTTNDDATNGGEDEQVVVEDSIELLEAAGNDKNNDDDDDSDGDTTMKVKKEI